MFLQTFGVIYISIRYKAQEITLLITLVMKVHKLRVTKVCVVTHNGNFV